MKKFIYFIVIFSCTIVFSQKNKNKLYLFLDNPQYSYSCEQNLGFGFAINSEDDRFSTNYYKFDIYNIKGFSNNKYDYEYYTIDELRKEVSIDTIKYETIKEFTRNKKFWEIHNELSLFKKIFFIEKRKLKSTKYKYFIIPAIYEGTRKNVMPTDLSISK